MINKKDKDFIKCCFKTLKKNHTEKFKMGNLSTEIPQEMVDKDKNEWKLI